MSEPIVLYSKEGLEFKKIKNNNYNLIFDMENYNIILAKIIDFSLLKLIYELNGDIYEKTDIKKINENEAILTLLMKNLFEDLGLPQRFTYVHIKKNIEEHKISFVSESIRSERPQGIPIDSKLMPIKTSICDCFIINPHKIKFCCDITFDDEMNIPQFAEKIVGLILFKIFKRVKQFIENVRL
jgi:hypothetical protein